MTEELRKERRNGARTHSISCYPQNIDYLRSLCRIVEKLNKQEQLTVLKFASDMVLVHEREERKAELMRQLEELERGEE